MARAARIHQGLSRDADSVHWPAGRASAMFQTHLLDLATDPGQFNPIQDLAVEGRMVGLLEEALLANQAPPEQYERLGLSSP